MINSNKFMNRLFRRIGGVVWDVMSGTVGLQTKDGIYTVTFGEDGAAQLNVNPLDSLGIALPAFATQATYDEVSQGDIIVGDSGIIGWVVSKTEAAYKVLDHNGHHKTYSPPKVAIFGGSGVLVVRNLMSLTGGAANSASFASNLLPLLMLGGGDDGKLEKILPLLLMTSQAPAAAANGTPAAAANPFASMLPMLMLTGGLEGLGGSGKKGGLDPITLMALSGGLGGGAGGMNPLVMMSLLGKGGLGDLGGLAATEPEVPELVPVRRGVPALQRL